MKNRTKTNVAVPSDTRVYAIGDIHGRRDLLDKLLTRIKRDAQSAPKRRVLILLGDYVDRGPDSAGVLERVAALSDGKVLNGFKTVMLKGNHEDMMLRFLDGRDKNGQWLENGGAQTVESYGLNVKASNGKLRHALLDALPRSHRRVLKDLKLRHEEGGYGFAHAGVRPGVTWERQTPSDLVWIRRTFLDSDYDFGRVVVHGHTPTTEPVVKKNRIGVDTRAWESGTLTCLVLEKSSHRFLTT